MRNLMFLETSMMKDSTRKQFRIMKELMRRTPVQKENSISMRLSEQSTIDLRPKMKYIRKERAEATFQMTWEFQRLKNMRKVRLNAVCP